MSNTDEELTRLFDRAFDTEAPGDGLWDSTRTAMRRKVRARQAVLAASVAVVAALAVAVPQVLLSQRVSPDVEFFAPPGVDERREAGVEHDEKPLHLDPATRADAEDEPTAASPSPTPTPSPAARPTPTPSPAAEGSGTGGQPERPAVTDWYTIDLTEEIDPFARYFSAWRAMDALVANMSFGSGAQVAHGVRDAQESSATGWIEVSGTQDDSVSGEEIRVEIVRDHEGWFVVIEGQARATCARGVDETDRSRCV